MRILHVIPSVNPANGGPIEGVKHLSKVLMSEGHKVEVASLDAPEAPWVSAFPLKVHVQGPSHLGYAYSMRFGSWLRANARHYDAVIVDGIWQYHSFAVWKALRGATTPYFVFTHGMLDPWFKHTYPLKHLKKCLYWPWAEYRVLRDARGVCFTCEEERLLARQSFRPYQCNEIVISYGTAVPEGKPNVQRVAFYTQFPELRSKRLLLFLGRLHFKKGCDLLIEAFAKVASGTPALHLVMAGPDQAGWRAQLQAQAVRLGIEERITWPGMLSCDLKWGAFRAAEAFILPSHQENFGIAVAEAMACGLPVLISDKVNIWREIKADGAGLVDHDTIQGTTSLLQRWLALSDEERQTMQRNAERCFKERFEIHRAAQCLVDALRAGGAT